MDLGGVWDGIWVVGFGVGGWGAIWLGFGMFEIPNIGPHMYGIATQNMTWRKARIRIAADFQIIDMPESSGCVANSELRNKKHRLWAKS